MVGLRIASTRLFLQCLPSGERDCDTLVDGQAREKHYAGLVMTLVLVDVILLVELVVLVHADVERVEPHRTVDRHARRRRLVRQSAASP